MRRALQILILFAAVPAWAGSRAFFAGAESGMTSDDIKQQRFIVGAVSDRSDVLWNYTEERERGTHWGLGIERFEGRGRLVNERPNYQIDRPYVLVNHKFSSLWSAEADLGWFSYSAKSPSHDGSEFTGFARTTWKASQEFYMIAALGRSSLLQDMMLVSAVTDPMIYTSLYWQGTYTFYSSWKLQQSFDQRWISDGNQRWNSDTSLMYAFSQYPTWFWLGLGMNTLGFSERSANYWTPKSVRSIGPRVEISYPIREEIILKMGGSVSSLQEEDFDSAIASYVRAAVQVGGREKRNAELAWTSIQTERASSKWTQQSLGLILNWPF